MGFMTGSAPHEESPRRVVEDAESEKTLDPGSIAEASSYLERRRAEDREWSTLSGAIEAIGEPELSDIDRRQALSERGTRRAYRGAPPRIPHGLDSGDDGACLACHREGVQVGSRTASPIPHAELQLCTQCHVPAQDLIPGGNSLEPGLHDLSNTFEGLEERTHDARTNPMATPQVPHTSWMRENCLACHGERGANALQASHPEATHCVQCHALSDAMDQGSTR